MSSEKLSCILPYSILSAEPVPMNYNFSSVTIEARTQDRGRKGYYTTIIERGKSRGKSSGHGGRGSFISFKKQNMKNIVNFTICR